MESKFTVGDKVRVMDNYHGGNLRGRVGVVRCIDGPTLVEFPGWNRGHGGFGDFIPTDGKTNCWYFGNDSYLELITEEKTSLEGELLVALAEFLWEITTPVIAKPVRSRSVSPGAITILNHLKKRGSISPVEAFSSYGTLRLAARIHDLREAGNSIKTEMRKDAAGHSYARYTLA